MHPRLHGADVCFRYARYFFERKILDVVQQQDGSVWQRQFIQQSHKYSLLFAPNEQIVRAIFKFIRRIRNVIQQQFRSLAPALDDFLMRDAKEPTAEFGVFAQAADVPDGGDERLLHNIEAGRQAYPGGAAYCAAKAGELQITRALRYELFGTGIRVSTVDPGLAETEFSLVRFKGDAKKAKALYAGTNPLVAEDIADILTWLACRPPHVNIDELVVKPVDQVEVGKVFQRRKR